LGVIFYAWVCFLDEKVSDYWRSDGKDMELPMIYKISPNPSFPKRGKERGNFAKEGEKKERELFLRGELKNKNYVLDYWKPLSSLS